MSLSLSLAYPSILGGVWRRRRRRVVNQTLLVQESWAIRMLGALLANSRR